MSGYLSLANEQSPIAVWLGVAGDPVLPVLKNIPGYFAVAPGNGPDGETNVVVQQNEAEAPVNSLNVRKLNASFAKRVLHVDAGFVDGYTWAPEQQPCHASDKNETKHDSRADFRSQQIDCDRSKAKEPNQKRSDLVRARTKLLRRHPVILTDKAEVRA